MLRPAHCSLYLLCSLERKEKKPYFSPSPTPFFFSFSLQQIPPSFYFLHIKGHGEGNGNPLQYSCLENSVDRGAWWAAVHGVAQSQTWLKQLSMHACIGEGNGNPLQCSCLENPRDGGAWWAAIYVVAQSRTWLKWISSSSISMEKGI